MNKKIKRYIKKFLKLCGFIKIIDFVTWQCTKIHNDKVKIDDCVNLMIVAHPDDEMIFFDKYLRDNKNTLVLCLTNGGNRIRVKEFFSSMNMYSTKGIILNYLDSIDGKWNESEVIKCISSYNAKNNWINILTHNEDGEYGHFQHILTNKLVNICCGNNKIMVPLLSEKRFSKDGLLTRNQIKDKEIRFEKIYKSQSEGILNKNDIYYKYFIYESIGIKE